MGIAVKPAGLDGVRLISPARIEDTRGFFSEVYKRNELEAAGLFLDIVQENHSLSGRVERGAGIHFKLPPFDKDKLIRAVRGRIIDVAVDIRKSSQTYGRHITVELSAENWQQLLVPKGFAHGFCTLEPDTEVLYKVTNYYAPDFDRGILWNDPDLGIEWPVEGPNLSDADRTRPRLRDIPSYFD